MHRCLWWALRVFFQFVVAGGFTRAFDAWVVDLGTASQLTVLALVQLSVAFAQAYLEDHGVLPPVLGPASPLDPQRARPRGSTTIGKGA